MKRLTPTKSALIRSAVQRSVRSASVLLTAFVLVAMLGLTGCPAPEVNPGQNARLTMLLAADGGSFASAKALGDKARVVAQNEINSLMVNLDEIRLTRTTSSGSEVVTAFSDPIQINLLDLVGVNDVLDSVVVPEGDYTAVQLVLSTPQLTLASDPGTVIDAITLPDGGSLTVNAAFSTSGSDAGLLVLQLGSISLVSLDDGSYQLVPDLQVELVDTTVDAQAIGIINAVDGAAGTFLLKRDGAEVTVDYSGARIFKPSDFDTASGSAADLVVGLKVFATGTLSVDGNLESDLIVIFPGAPTHTSSESITFQLIGNGAEQNARGEAEYEVEGDRSKLKIEVEGLAYTGMIDVDVDGTVVATVDSVGNDSKDDGNKFEFRIDTRLGDVVPVVTTESTLTLHPAGTADVLLSGTATVGSNDDSNSSSDDSSGDDHGGDTVGSDDTGVDDNGGDTVGSDDTGIDDHGSDAIGSDDSGVDDNGGDTVGSDDSGVDDHGSDTVGSDDSGVDDNGGDTVGSDDSGVDDNGGDTVGSDDSGVDDNGGDTVGSDDSGVDDHGSDAVGSDDLGVDDNGGDTVGSDDSGVDDHGGDTVGSDDSGVDDNGGDTVGSDDSGVDDHGGDTVGSDDSGVDDHGGDTVGSDDSGVDDNGGDTVGSDDSGADDHNDDSDHSGSDDGSDDSDSSGSDDRGIDG